LLIYIGYFLNISLSLISDFNNLSQFGLLIPWAVYLAIPGLMKCNNINKYLLWKYFFNIMLFMTILSVSEYFLVFFGLTSLEEIKTPNGNFLAGFFSIFHQLETGEVHQILYGPFMESGTLAMLLLPVMAYAFFMQKYVSLLIFSIGLILTNSLGGVMGLCMLAPFLIYFKFNLKRNIALILTSLLIMPLAILFGNGLIERYQEKNLSRETREISVLGFINVFPVLIVQYPLGMPLGDSHGGADISKNYYGSNFTPGNAFYLGGVMAFFGYLAVLLISLKYALSLCFCRVLSIEEKTVGASIFCLMPFIVQREVIWDNGLFPFLFSPFIVLYILNKNKNLDNFDDK